MRKKLGFTLAEVLITLSIIGVVAAITLPSLMTSYQYKTVGVKLSKFMAAAESGARAYVVANGSFNSTDTAAIADFVDSSFVIKEIASKTTGDFETDDLGADGTGHEVTLKDGTSIVVEANNTATNIDSDKYPAHKYGAPAMLITFRPNIQGMPSTAVQAYDFVVTELGYTVPSNADNDNANCNRALFDEDYLTKQSDFKEGTACYKTGD